ncbi:hypothetical protein F4808DRAFT_466115 [Astrocystis sublimbata]|nr:hypothetical protein F4808DRAFT_466115 [Astrocystis sublimbata]
MSQVKRKATDVGTSSGDHISKRRAEPLRDQSEAGTALTASNNDLERRLAATFEGFADGFKTSYRELHALVEELKYENKALSKENEALSKENETLSKDNETLVQDIDRIAGIRHRAPDVDRGLGNQLLDLRQQIRSFTFKFCVAKFSPASTANLPDYVKAMLSEVSAATAKHLKSTFHARYLIQAMIWRFLCDFLLTDPFKIWGDGIAISNVVSTIKDSSKVPPQTRQIWGTLTGQVLSTISGPRRARRAEWLRNLLHLIQPLVIAEHLNDISEKVESILDNAIDLAKNLAQSRTICFIQRKDCDSDENVSQVYDGEWMEVVEKALQSYEDIDFLVSPALVQITNSACEKLNPRLVLIKAEVCHGRGRNLAPVPSASCPTSQTQGHRMTSSGRRSRRVDRLDVVADDIGSDEQEENGEEAQSDDDEEYRNGESDVSAE